MNTKWISYLTLFFLLIVVVPHVEAKQDEKLPQLQMSEFVTNISPHDFSACGLTNLGNVYCWGMDFNYVDHNTPYFVSGLGVSTQIAVGTGYACALGADGKVRCWGNNNDAQLGRDPSQTLRSDTPLEVPGISQVKAIAVGNNHSCAVKIDGSLYCWGNNQYGKVGTGNTHLQIAPYKVTFPEAVKDVVASKYNTCALSDVIGRVYCWGNNAVGQVGIGFSSQEASLLPQGVSIAGIKKLVMDEAHVCAITIANGVLCWGGNYAGELGHDPKLDEFPDPGSPSKQDNIIPIPVDIGAGLVLDVSTGHQFTCYVMLGGGVRCLGNNNGSLGTLGNGGYLIYTYQPVRVYNIRGGMAKLVSSEGNTYAITSSGSIYCWGSCYRGDGSVRSDHTTPIHFTGMLGVPSLGSNYLDGQDGSIFSISGQGFGDNLDVGLTANSNVLSPDMKIKTSSEGQFTFDLNLFGTSGLAHHMTAHKDGSYRIMMTVGGQSASVILKVSALAPKRALEEPASSVMLILPTFVNPLSDISVFLPFAYK